MVLFVLKNRFTCTHRSHQNICQNIQYREACFEGGQEKKTTERVRAKRIVCKKREKEKKKKKKGAVL